MSAYPAELSIIIPVYNESQRLSAALTICVDWARRQPGWEFIFVNDGSSDDTVAKLQPAVRTIKQFTLLSYPVNHGKGFALKQGVAQAVKPLVLICDLDFSTPLKDLSLLYPFVAKGADLAIGSRKALGAKVLKHQAPFREWLGKQFTNLSKMWLGLTVTDVTCGFKLFTTPVAKKLFASSRVNRWGYDAEILFLAKKHGFKVVDVPVTWINDERTKVNILRDIFNSLTDLLTIRANDWLGHY
jgi:glycosyltransferase involved in cell wall biosynthesis